MANRKSTPAPSSKPANNSEVKRAASVGDVKGKAKEVAEDVADDGSFQAGSPILFYKEEAKPTLPLATETTSTSAPPSPLPVASKPPSPSPSTRRLKKTRKAFSFQSLLLRLSVLYIGYAYFFLCPSASLDGTVASPPVCHGLELLNSNYRNLVLPVLSPIYTTHIEATLLPLYEHLEPYNRMLEPYLNKIIINSQPVLAKCLSIYQRVISPHLNLVGEKSAAILGPYMARWKKGAQRVLSKVLTPSYEWYSREIGVWLEVVALPKYRSLEAFSYSFAHEVKQIVNPILEKGIPFIQTQVVERLLPFAKTSLSTSYTFTTQTFLPKFLQTMRVTKTFVLEQFLPRVRDFWTTYGSPQVERILEKVSEYRAGAETVVVNAREEIEVEKFEPIEAVEQLVEPIQEAEPVVAVLPAVEEAVRVLEEPAVEEAVEPAVIIEIVEVEYVDGAESVILERQIVIDQPIDDLDQFIAELSESSPEEVLSASPAIPTYTPPSTEEIEAQALLTKEKRLGIEKLQDFYEQEISNLGISLSNELVEQLIESRGKTVEGFEPRFRSVLEKIDEEGDKMIGRLSKYFQRLASPQSQSKINEDKLIESTFLAKKAVEKVRGKMLKDALDDVTRYIVTVDLAEKDLVNEMSGKIEDLVAVAQADLGMKWTWLEDVRYSDWQRYHNLAKASTSFTGLQNGSIHHDQLDRLTQSIDQEFQLVEDELKAIVVTFESLLSLILEKGQLEFRNSSEPYSSEPLAVETVIPVVSQDSYQPVEEAGNIDSEGEKIETIASVEESVPEASGNLASIEEFSVVEETLAPFDKAGEEVEITVVAVEAVEAEAAEPLEELEKKIIETDSEELVGEESAEVIRKHSDEL